MNDSKSEITLADLVAFPVWRFDPETELYGPLIDIDTPIGSVDELHFRATITSRNGHVFEGSVTGKGDIAIGIFSNGRWYSLNKDWKQASLDQLGALIRDSHIFDGSSPEAMFPFQFKTMINKRPFVDWVDEFDFR